MTLLRLKTNEDKLDGYSDEALVATRIFAGHRLKIIVDTMLLDETRCITVIEVNGRFATRIAEGTFEECEKVAFFFATKADMADMWAANVSGFNRGAERVQ